MAVEPVGHLEPVGCETRADQPHAKKARARAAADEKRSSPNRLAMIRARPTTKTRGRGLGRGARANQSRSAGPPGAIKKKEGKLKNLYCRT